MLSYISLKVYTNFGTLPFYLDLVRSGNGYIAYIIWSLLAGLYIPTVIRVGFEAIFYPYMLTDWLSGIPTSVCDALIWILASAVLFWFVVQRRVKGKG